MKMKALPRITVVTPSYNQARFLATTIESVVHQEYPGLEFMIVDGGSTDDSLSIIHTYENKIAYWTSEPDRGQSSAINKGFVRATGDIVAWLNSDDCYCKNALTVVGNYFALHPGCMWLAGNILFMDVNGKIIRRKKPYFSRFILRHGSSSLYQPNVFVNRKVLKEVGFLNEEFHAIMDREWFCRIAERYEPALVDVDLALFRWHPASKSSSGNKSKHWHHYLNERVQVSGAKSQVLKYGLDRASRAILAVLESVARAEKFVQRALYLFGVKRREQILK